MKSQEINVGDTVFLKSGGPMLTVATLAPMPDGTTMQACVQWFDAAGGQLMNASMPVTSLRGSGMNA